MSAFVIDAFEFCRSNGYREGTTPVAEMTRLAAECADPSGTRRVYEPLAEELQAQIVRFRDAAPAARPDGLNAVAA